MGVLRRHLPEGVLDDDRRIVAYTQFQKENALPTSGAEKVLIPLRCSVPAFVFHKGIIAAEIHGHRLATVRADRQKFRWYFHIFLLFLFLDAIQPIASNFFTSIGKAAKGILLSLTRQVIFLLPLLIVLPIFFGIDGVMYAGPASDFVAAVLAGILVVKEFRLMRKQEQNEIQTAEN